MERWRALLGGVRARGLTTIGLVISDPVAFADAFLGAMSAGFWVAPLDPSMPVGGSGGLAVTLARTGVDLVLADHPAPAGIDGEWIELDRLGAPAGRARDATRARRHRSVPAPAASSCRRRARRARPRSSG